MDNQASIYSEKKLAYFEAVYRETKLSKPQDVNITVTAEHIYGIAYICDQTGTKEEDPVYTRFSCGLEEITKIYINNNNKMNPIYIQCDDNAKGVINRRRIILPCFSNNDEIVKVINDAKAEFDEKLEKQHELEKAQKLKELEARRRAQDDDFERMTSGYKDMIKPETKHTNAAEPAPAPKAEPKPAPAPKAEPKPAPAPAPKREPKPAPAPAPAPKASPKPAPAPDTDANNSSVTVEDILGLDDILGIRANEAAPESFMEAVSDEPDEKVIESMPEETIQKNPDELEAVAIPDTVPEEIKTVKEEKPAVNSFEELDTSKEIAKKLTPQSAKPSKPKPAPAPVPEAKPEPAKEIEILPHKENMTLEEFETAVKKLKTMLDNGVISDSEFAAEKKKLLTLLY